MNIEIGQRIKFRVTVRDGVKTATRIVNGFSSNGNPTVRFWTYPNFEVRPSEILECIG